MEPKGPICPSCGMPMERAEDFGTREDGGESNDYCCFCFKKGAFTDPNISMDEMIEKLVGMASQMEMSEFQARDMARNVLPTLKRWQSK